MILEGGENLYRLDHILSAIDKTDQVSEKQFVIKKFKVVEMEVVKWLISKKLKMDIGIKRWFVDVTTGEFLID